MSSHWFSIVALLAALAIGYSFLGTRNVGLNETPEQPVLVGYYVHNAIIDQTDDAGRPSARFAATDVTQDPNTDNIVMTSVRADYVLPNADNRHKADRWVLNANRATLPEALNVAPDAQRIQLQGDVEARSIGATHNASLTTDRLTIDTERQQAYTDDRVHVLVDRYATSGRGLDVDMKRHSVTLKSDVTLRLAGAELPSPTADATPPATVAESLALPELFESDSFEYQDNVLLLTNVRSKSAPFVSARQARATGADLANNQVELHGAVRVELPKRGLLTADDAVVTVRGGRIVHAKVTGSPVNFQHQAEGSDQIVRGRAAQIDYDVATQTLQFTGEPWFNNGKFEITSEYIEYNLATEAARGTRSRGNAVPNTAAIPQPH